MTILRALRSPVREDIPAHILNLVQCILNIRLQLFPRGHILLPQRVPLENTASSGSICRSSHHVTETQADPCHRKSDTSSQVRHMSQDDQPEAQSSSSTHSARSDALPPDNSLRENYEREKPDASRQASSIRIDPLPVGPHSCTSAETTRSEKTTRFPDAGLETPEMIIGRTQTSTPVFNANSYLCHPPPSGRDKPSLQPQLHGLVVHKTNSQGSRFQRPLSSHRRNPDK